jgi:hypothetical protein
MNLRMITHVVKDESVNQLAESYNNLDRCTVCAHEFSPIYRLTWEGAATDAGAWFGAFCRVTQNVLLSSLPHELH